MILLYPGVHDYSEPQKEEITSFVYDTFYAARQPMIQEQYSGPRFLDSCLSW